ncbi:glutathione S-transferase family protein [Lysobacter sp. TY2-98]|uniref:glutathione S-transferase family protein n=1 Tax=Lysobacter sp. TY2-98 TaxID=2290922 RepID=UPI002711E68B|nr:glutathione S-transferase family protein [Lysobacter sp. TY2-98]
MPYRLHGLDHTGGELDGDAYGDISCFRQVPVIDDEGFVLSESAAIALYLAEKSGRLIPPDFQGRTRVTQWCFAALATVELPLAQLQMLDNFGKGDAQLRVWLVAWAERVLGNLEGRLDGREWIACAGFTAADLLMAAVLREIRKTDLLDRYPAVQAFYGRAFARPAWSRTLEAYAQRHGVEVASIR